MNDATTDAYRMTDKSNAESACLEAMVRYFNNPTPQLKAVMEVKMEEFASLHKPSKEAIDAVKTLVAELESNDILAWQKFQEVITSMFKHDDEVKELMIETIFNRGIGK